jgi:hypothetical protein
MQIPPCCITAALTIVLGAATKSETTAAIHVLYPPTAILSLQCVDVYLLICYFLQMTRERLKLSPLFLKELKMNF